MAAFGSTAVSAHDPDLSLRHDPARRHPARGHLPFGRGQADDRPAPGGFRHALYRVRLAGLQPEGRRLLRPRQPDEPRSHAPDRLRQHAPQGHELRRGPEPAGAAEGRHAGRHARRQELGLPRQGGAGGHARREPRHDPRQHRLDEGAGARGGVRRRALLRRLRRQPRLCACGAAGRRRSRCRLAGAVRDQRRPAAVGGGGDHPRGRGSPRPPARHPLPQRQRLRGGQLARGSARRRHAGAGHDQRLWRACRQRRPDDHPAEPPAQDGPRGDRRRSGCAS